MVESRWRRAGSTPLRVVAVWMVSTLTMLALAGLLPDFRLQSEDGESITRTAVTAAWGAGAFGLLSALVWPVVVRALLLVPALLLGLLVFFLNGSLLLLALRLIPDGGGGGPGDRGPRRRRDVRRRLRDLHGPRRARRQRLPAPALPARHPAPPKTR